MYLIRVFLSLFQQPEVPANFFLQKNNEGNSLYTEFCMHRPRVTDIISVPFEFRACFFPSNLSSVTIKNFSPGFCPAAHASKIHSPELSVTYPTPQSEVCHPAKLPPNPIIPYMTAASRTWLPRMVWPCIHPIRIGAGF